MSKLLQMTSLAATAAALAFTATPALAVNATSNATARARIVKPLQLTSSQNLDFGIIVLSGTGTWSATVQVDENGVRDCDGGSGNVTCSGTFQEAVYNVAGTQGQDVRVTVSSVTLSDGAATPNLLTLTPDYATKDLTLANSGAPGNDFGVGGSITVDDSTADGVYTGTLNVTADYL